MSITNVEKEQISLLKEIVLRNSEKLGLDAWEKMALNLNLSDEQLRIIEDIMNSFEERLDSFKYFELENALKDELAISYQTVKYIIRALFEDRLYVNVIKNFLTNMNQLTPGLPIEYKRIFEKISSE
ncbi:hypothetical protein [Avibacterium paragallinarum]|uniref:hypothetical protein n=1 Tax=Avibacterium paragallinarum TaxID=728 RepID=UPI003988FCDB